MMGRFPVGYTSQAYLLFKKIAAKHALLKGDPMQTVRNESLRDHPVQEDKKPYARPQLIQHGAVETLTQHGNGGESECLSD
jgi:hypothetical protein